MKFWKKHEIPHCEIKSVKFGNLGSPVVITLTRRGSIELRKRERKEARDQAKRNRGVPIAWVLGFDDPCRFGG